MKQSTDFDNKIIQFLPEHVAEEFPNLLSYDANNCLIKAVSKKISIARGKWFLLSLGSNQIEQIASNTFEDLTSLEFLSLSKKFFFPFLLLSNLFFAPPIPIDACIIFFELLLSSMYSFFPLQLESSRKKGNGTLSNRRQYSLILEFLRYLKKFKLLLSSVHLFK